jgi:fructokinase
MKMFTCFGEVLWDVFDHQKKIGGAPLNVALRLKSFNDNVSIISAIGNDNLGKALLNYLHENKLTTDYIQINNHYETGQVLVTLDKKGSASYDIKFPSVWDYIELTSSSIDLVKQSEVFVFGSLVCRNNESKSTLLKLLEYAKFKVFDVNLRPPHYSFDVLKELMIKADFIKFNDEELDLISKTLESGFNSIEDNIKYISSRFNTSQICVTRGNKGAVLFIDNKFYYNEGYPVNVKDTVGAGDSFLATVIFKLSSTNNPQLAIDYACAVGAIVASSEGANPCVSDEKINQLIG